MKSACSEVVFLNCLRTDILSAERNILDSLLQASLLSPLLLPHNSTRNPQTVHISHIKLNCLGKLKGIMSCLISIVQTLPASTF